MSRQLRLIEGVGPRSQARRAWATSRQRHFAIAAVIFLVAGVFGLSADLPSPWVSASVPAVGYLVGVSVLHFLGNRWMNKYSAVMESRKLVDLTGSSGRRSV